MIMTPRLRRFALAAHIAASVGWIGAVAGYIALDVVAATGRDAQTLRAAYIAMGVIAWYVVVPLAVASLMTGLVMSLGTRGHGEQGQRRVRSLLIHETILRYSPECVEGAFRELRA